MKTLPALQTSRLILRQMKLSDVNALIRYAHNEKIADNIFNIPFPYLEKDAIQRFNTILQGFEAKERYIFAITLQEKNELIGEIGIHLDDQKHAAEMGYWLAEEYWSKGFISEAVQVILAFGFNQLGLNKIFATHFLDNPASGKVLKKNRMIKEAELKDHYFYNGRVRSIAQYRLTKDEFLSSP